MAPVEGVGDPLRCLGLVLLGLAVHRLRCCSTCRPPGLCCMRSRCSARRLPACEHRLLCSIKNRSCWGRVPHHIAHQSSPESSALGSSAYNFIVPHPTSCVQVHHAHGQAGIALQHHERHAHQRTCRQHAGPAGLVQCTHRARSGSGVSPASCASLVTLEQVQPPCRHR